MAGARRRRTGWRKHLPEAREWINATTGLAALLLAVISFWTTARISGLEDYLRSEISRRNTELDVLAGKSSAAERLAMERERQLASLDAATNEIIAASLSAQSQLAASQASLAGVRSEVAKAQDQLTAVERTRDRIAESFATQSRDFDLFQRQQAFQLASIQLSRSSTWVAIRDTVPSSAAMLADVEKLSAPPNQPEIARYYEVIRSGTRRACPAFASEPVNLPREATPPGEPPKGVRVYSLTDPAYVAFQRAYTEWSHRNDQYWKDRSAYDKARISEQFRLLSEVKKCMCKAISTPEHPSSRVCAALET